MIYSIEGPVSAAQYRPFPLNYIRLFVEEKKEFYDDSMYQNRDGEETK